MGEAAVADAGDEWVSASGEVVAGVDENLDEMLDSQLGRRDIVWAGGEAFPLVMIGAVVGFACDCVSMAPREDLRWRDVSEEGAVLSWCRDAA